MPRITLPGEKQFVVSIFITTGESPRKTLLLHHKKYNVWISPGGHTEKDENPVETAIRETKEETGIDISFLRKKISSLPTNATQLLPTPDYFFEEEIPPYGDEPAHYHLDMVYVVNVDHQQVQASETEAHDIGWFTKDEALQLDIYENTKLMLKKVLHTE